MSEADALDRVMLARHSCRAFLPDPIEPAVITRILVMAQRSASWCNAQPWRLIVTGGSATEAFRAALVAHAATSSPTPDIPFPEEYRGIYRERRRETAQRLYGAVGITMGDRAASARQAAENFSLFGAPHVAIVTTDAALGAYGIMDCGGFVAAFLLAATALGVATIAQASIAAHSGLVRAHFGVPAGREVVCGISFGRADTTHPANAFRTGRAPPDQVVQWRK